MSKTTVAEHLQNAHEAMGQHHKRMAKLAGKAGDKDAQAEHESMSECHGQMAKECEAGMAMKAMGVDNQNAIVPDRISAIITGFPPVRAVPRSGAPTPGDVKQPNVPLEFRDLVKVDDD